MERVAVLGTGLIGGSIGLGLAGRSAPVDVVGYDRDSAAATRAVERGAVSRICGTPREAIAGADLVVLAVPLGQFEPLLQLLGGELPATATVTDVASAKAAVVEAAEAALGARFVGGHPMAGSEREDRKSVV